GDRTVRHLDFLEQVWKGAEQARDRFVANKLTENADSKVSLADAGRPHKKETEGSGWRVFAGVALRDAFGTFERSVSPFGSEPEAFKLAVGVTLGNARI